MWAGGIAKAIRVRARVERPLPYLQRKLCFDITHLDSRPRAFTLLRRAGPSQRIVTGLVHPLPMGNSRFDPPGLALAQTTPDDLRPRLPIFTQPQASCSWIQPILNLLLIIIIPSRAGQSPARIEGLNPKPSPTSRAQPIGISREPSATPQSPSQDLPGVPFHQELLM